MTEPSGARLPTGKQTVGGESTTAGPVGREDDVVGIDAIECTQPLFESSASLALLPPVEIFVEGLAGDGANGGVEQAGAAQVKHHLGYASGEKDLDGGEVVRTVGQSIDEARNLAIDRRSSRLRWGGADRRHAQSRECAEGDSSSRRRRREGPWRCGWRRRRGHRLCRCRDVSCAAWHVRSARRWSSQMGWPEGASAV